MDKIPDFDNADIAVEEKGRRYTIYGSKKIQIRMTDKQKDFIFQQLRISQFMRADIVRYIFNWLGDRIKESKAGNKSAISDLIESKAFPSGMNLKIGKEIEKVLYVGKYKELGATLVNFQESVSDISTTIFMAVRRIGKFKLSALPYFDVYIGKEILECHKFCLTKSFHKDRNNQYADSFHLYLPQLKWVRLKDREGYFTRKDWDHCYKVTVVRSFNRTYLVFSLKCESDDTNESWSAKSESYFRTRYIRKYKVPIAPSTLKRGFSDSMKFYKLAPRDVPEFWQKANEIESHRQYAIITITRDYSFSILVGTIRGGLTQMPFYQINDLISNPYGSVSMDASLNQRLIGLMCQFNDNYRNMTSIVRSNLINHGFDPMNYDLKLKRSVFEVQQLEMKIYHSKNIESIRRKQRIIRRRITNIVTDVANKMISKLCLKLPETIFVRLEDGCLINSDRPVSRHCLTPKDISIGTIGIFLERLFNKARMLEIPVLVFNEDKFRAAASTISLRKVCEFCETPYPDVQINPLNDFRDFAKFKICKNPKCFAHNPASANSIPTTLSIRELNIWKALNAPGSSSSERVEWFDTNYFRKWYPRYRKFKRKGSPTFNQLTGLRYKSEPIEPTYIFGPEYDSLFSGF